MTSYEVLVTWQPGNSYDVNTVSGGGHKIYYHGESDVTKDTTGVLVVDVPNTSSLTQGTITGLPDNCTIFVRVGSYSKLNPAGGELSAEQTVTVQNK